MGVMVDVDGSVQFNCSVMSDFLPPHGLQHGRLLFQSTTPGACSNSCPSNWWCHPTISSSGVGSLSLLQETSPTQGSIKPRCPELQADSFTRWASREALFTQWKDVNWPFSYACHVRDCLFSILLRSFAHSRFVRFYFSLLSKESKFWYLEEFLFVKQK